MVDDLKALPLWELKRRREIEREQLARCGAAPRTPDIYEATREVAAECAKLDREIGEREAAVQRRREQ